MSYALTITFVDRKNEGFVQLGAAAWKTRKEQLAQWNAVPAATSKTCFLLDKWDRHDCIEDDKYITAETVEMLLDEPIATLIERGRNNTCFTLAELKARHGSKAA
jgi:hypothetical protein